MPVHHIPYKAGPDLSPYEQERCRLDVHPAAGTPAGAGAPVVLFFHGGAIQGGDKESSRTLAALLNPRGIIVAGANYRLSPRATYPAYLHDCAAAVAWIKGNIARFGGDPGRLFLAGHSAGGYLAMMSVLGPGWLAAVGLAGADVAGIVSVSGQMVTHSTVREERGIPRSVMVVDDAAPLRHARGFSPAILLVCAEHDMPARLEENLLMQAWLQAAGHRDVTLLCVPGRDHASVYDECAKPGDPTGQALVDFIHRDAPVP